MLDANVFFLTRMTDALLVFADSDLYDPIWSIRIMDEVREHLPQIWTHVDSEGLERYLATIAKAFPKASVEGRDSVRDTLELPDPDDRHVLATAIEAKARYIVTENLKDFPAEFVTPWGVQAVSADDFLAMLYDEDTEQGTRAMRILVEEKRHPPRTMEEEIAQLKRYGMTRFASRLGQACTT